MPTPAGNEPVFLFSIVGTSYKISVVDFTLIERISSPFELNASLASVDEIKFDVVGKEALLTILGHDKDRYCHGVISKFMYMGSSGRFHLYQARVVPAIWLLSLEQDCRIFQEKTVEDIVREILQEAKITGDRFDFRTQNKSPKREYCVQYRETDLNFISRILEEEGIFYFFEHTKNKHVLVFGDSTVAHKPIEGKAEVLFNPIGMVPKAEYICRFNFSRRIYSGKATQKDFNFKKPSLDLTCPPENQSRPKPGELEIYDYPGNYMDQDRGKKLTKIRLEENMTFKQKCEGQSFCPRLLPGFKFKLKDHEPEDFKLDQEYLLVEVIHTGTQPQVLEERLSGSEEVASYVNDFTGIPSSVTFRPERKTPKSIVEGLQTALVTGPKGEKSYTDEEPYGRIKVQFHWDREGKHDEKTTCWLRVAYPYAGEKHGMQFTPLIGDEVLVAFLEGDPDKPVIVGSFFKGEDKSLIAPKDMIKNEILTPHQHRLLFDDKGACIIMNTGTDHFLRMSQNDELKGIKLNTNNGHTILMQKDSGVSNIQIFTEKTNSMTFDDQNEIINITDMRAALTIDIDSAKGQIRVHNAASGGGWILNECPNGKISLKSKDIEFFGDTSIKAVVGASQISIEPARITLSAGSGQIVLDPTGVTIMGALVKIN